MSFKYEYGCVMFDCDFSNWGKILSKVDERDLYNDITDDYGLSLTPHITALFGILPNQHTANEVKSFMTMNFSKPKPDDIKITEIDCFENYEYDVLKFKVDSLYLQNVNKVLCDNFNHYSVYSDYNPHITIAYLKKGRAFRYKHKLNNPIDVPIKNIRYSEPNETDNSFSNEIFFKLEDNV